MRFIITALIFVMVAGSFQSCVSKKKFDELQAAKTATDQALAETQSQVKTLGEEKDALAAEMASEKARLNGELSSLRTDMTAQIAQVNEKLNMTEAELKAIKDEINGMFAAYTDSGLTMEERDGRLYLVTEEPVNFRNSSSSLNRDQRNAIDAMAEKLKANPAIKVLVEGHTDNKQFAADAGTDNWDLSYARAKSVANRLIRKGVDASQITIAGHGDTMPAGDNATKEGREANRRTSLTPNPDLGGLLKAAGGN
ncbi:MAG: OmpA family protein [Lewinella sp.]|jgi:chemotaxis protein MotB|uniref:OmpA family protein n=1 Tax=Lewinella sp. TaxID=2004506 RepID=UPI003D6B3ED9